MSAPRCTIRDEQLVAFAYGELPPEAAQEMRAHLATCPRCRAAVAELEVAADLTRLIREASPAGEPPWRPLDLPLTPPRRWGVGFRWAAASALALAAAAVVLWLVLPSAPGPGLPAPTPPTGPAPEDLPPPPAERPALALQVLSREGLVLRGLPGGEPTRPLPPGVALRAGDELWTGPEASALLEAGDRTRLRLARSTRLRLDGPDGRGERFTLQSGTVACSVSPRPAGQTFRVETELAAIVVKGTRFVVRIEGPGGVWVAVADGAVEIAPRAAGMAPRLIRAGQGGHLERATLEVADLAPALRAELERLLVPVDRPESPAPVAPPPGPAGKPRSPPPRPAPAEPVPLPAPLPSPALAPGGDSLQALVESLYQDTAWIFDELRDDMARGRFDRVLSKIENYLADPESPDRAEALFLKAVCLEELGRTREARALYQDYLIRWPDGRRAADAQRGYLRATRGGR